MDPNLRRTIILDNYQNPTNKGLIEDEGYIKLNTNNESCIDEFDFQIKIENNIIKDIRFDGEACAISTSSASIMIKTLIGKTIDEALNIINNYENMIDEKEYDSNILEEANVYDEIYKQPNRKKCALLSWSGLKSVLIKHNE
ncbi:MAG: SUF system NifU family Fe-S cluster assembly protein [Bacilli bacterium]|nr:SUF system NifU family Fe-S cluster assembly protein [Bacilli bacterium]